MHLLGNNSTHPCNPANYGLWVNLHFFMCIYKHCFLPMLLDFAMKCCTKILCPLPHNHYCCLLPSPISLPHLLIWTCLISLPIVLLHLPTIICVMLMSIVFSYFLFIFILLLLYQMLHYFVTPFFWLVCVHIFSFALFVWFGKNVIINTCLLFEMYITRGPRFLTYNLV